MHRNEHTERNAAFARSMRPLVDRVAELRKRYAGSEVIATEPVFGCLADALGLRMRNARFQLAVVNGTEPSAREIAAFEKDLRTHAVRVLVRKSQTSSALADRMRNLATSDAALISVSSGTLLSRSPSINLPIADPSKRF